MKAITYDAYGGPERLRLEEVAPPAPGAGEVLLRIKAAGVNPYDFHYMRGEPRFMRLVTGLLRPKSRRLGRDVAGIVEALGPGVTEFAVGDEVYGAADGAFAERAIARAVELAPKSSSLSWAEAAAIPMAAITGLQGLQRADYGEGHRVLVNGASGGIGHFVVQMAKAKGCHVTAVCKTSNLDWVAALGADEVIDYTETPIFGGPATYDIIIDTVANAPVRRFLRLLTGGGAYVWLGSAKMGSIIGPLGRVFRMSVGPNFTRRALVIDAKYRREGLDEINSMVEAGTLRVVIEHEFPLSETGAAIAHVEAGHTKGKTVVVL